MKKIKKALSCLAWGVATALLGGLGMMCTMLLQREPTHFFQLGLVGTTPDKMILETAAIGFIIGLFATTPKRGE